MNYTHLKLISFTAIALGSFFSLASCCVNADKSKVEAFYVHKRETKYLVTVDGISYECSDYAVFSDKTKFRIKLFENLSDIILDTVCENYKVEKLNK